MRVRERKYFCANAPHNKEHDMVSSRSMKYASTVRSPNRHVPPRKR